jgi:hypothetical protein
MLSCSHTVKCLVHAFPGLSCISWERVILLGEGQVGQAVGSGGGNKVR